jgi:hypothetical protein
VSLFSSISAMPRIRSFSKSMELRISLDWFLVPIHKLTGDSIYFR